MMISRGRILATAKYDSGGEYQIPQPAPPKLYRHRESPQRVVVIGPDELTDEEWLYSRFMFGFFGQGGSILITDHTPGLQTIAAEWAERNGYEVRHISPDTTIYQAAQLATTLLVIDTDTKEYEDFAKMNIDTKKQVIRFVYFNPSAMIKP